MKNILRVLIFAGLFMSCSNAQESVRFYDMTNQQIDSLLAKKGGETITLTEKMNFYSQFFLETPYNFKCVGDGQYAILEPYPLVNFKETNCMAFCEHVLALSISDSWDNFFNNLQQIRYKDGLIGMRTRNHYTMADWLPENNWLLTDVSRKVGGVHTKTVTRKISHHTFFENKGISDMRHVLPDRELTIDYIPLSALPAIRNNLHVGDIGALLFADKTDIFSAHMFMVAEVDNQLIIRESSTSKMSTFDSVYEDWAAAKETATRYIGIALMRVREELNQPGKVILPWVVPALKSNLGQN